MQKFWELFEQSIITQAVITMVLIFTVCTMFIMGKPIPSELSQLTVLVVGFWFGSKVGYVSGVRKTAARLSKEE